MIVHQEQRQERIQQILKKVRLLEIKTRRLLSDPLVGAYRSVFKGQGMDFEEVREYSPGDDIRMIDWNVSAKMDRPYIKKFREERELTMLIAVDLSASLDFGSGELSKRDIAGELASMLAFSATKNHDKVGLLLFTDRIEAYIPPNKGKNHILRIIREVLFFEPQGRGTHYHQALNFIRQVLKCRTIIFLLSDFLPGERNVTGMLSEEEFRSLQWMHRHYDVVCVCIEDPRERTIPAVGWIRWEDGETGEIVEMNTCSRSFQERYAHVVRSRAQQLEDRFRRCGVDSFCVSTEIPFIHAFESFLKTRNARRR
ncbi:MAG: DUF58 domain-containing protein [Puniceicoccales bacterium]|jgi:uncharacterized protein (DUF58 family)|nr:DUF58 domain-containing protein [Puniceicoccales bacterium]